MENQEKRELVERVLGRFSLLKYTHREDGTVEVGHGPSLDGKVIMLDVDTLAAQAIVARCEVEHLTPVVCHASPYTAVTIEDDDGETHWISLDGLQGREGKAVCIFLPLKATEEE